jgi:hypothetical protein
MDHPFRSVQERLRAGKQSNAVSLEATYGFYTGFLPPRSRGMLL